MKKRIKPLGELEQLVMQVVWKKQCAKVRCVYSELEKTRSIAYTTVMTTMDRLEKKGLLKRIKVGKAYEYQACYSEDQLLKQTSRSIINSLIKNYGDLALAQFVDVIDSIDPKKLKELRKDQ